MTSPVVDLSHHNPTPNWNALREGGVVGVIHKASEGSSYVDDTLYSRARAAMDAGLKWATYHFMRPGDMREQMNHYLETVDPVDGERLCLDHEDAGVSLSQLAQAATYLLEDPRNLQVAIYSGHLLKEQLGGGYNETLAKCSLWVAQYTSASSPSWPSGTWPTWSLWQWTDSEMVPGISKPVDGNKWNGSIDQLLAWFGPAGEQPVPEPEPELVTTFWNVKVAITATAGSTIDSVAVIDVQKEE